MLRDNDPTEAIMFEDENHEIVYAPGGLKNPPLGTRRKYPQITADLSTRRCSSVLKIDVGDRLIKRQFRFSGDRKYLVITGERAEESAARAKYKAFETHRSYLDGKRTKRMIYHARIVKDATEKQVWDLLKQYGVNPHPAYQAGWGRTSCLTCIFGSANQWATVAKYMPDHLNKVIGYEKEFGVTIHRTMSIEEQVDLGTPYNVDPEVYKLAMSKDYNQEIILKGGWDLPKGAFGDSSGPTQGDNMSMNWMHEAVKHGIGGVNCGGIEGDRYHRDTTSSLRKKVDILKYLTTANGGRYVELSIKDGYVRRTAYVSDKEKAEIAKHNAAVHTDRKNLGNQISRLRKAFMAKYYPKVKYTGKGLEALTSDIKYGKDKSMRGALHDQIHALVLRREALPATKKMMNDALSLTDDGYKAYKTMFDIGVNIRYLYK